MLVFKILLLIFHFWSHNIENENTFITEKGCIIAYDGNIALDTICVHKSGIRGKDKNQIIKEVNGNVYKVEQKVPPIANFVNTYISIEEWSLKGSEFSLNSSLKIPLGNCYVKKLKINLKKNGIEWSYRKGFLKKKLRGFISYSKLHEMTEYELPCK